MKRQQMKKRVEKKAKKKGIRGKLPEIFLALVFLLGFGIFSYPTISDQWNTYRQSRLIASYEQTVNEMSDEDYQKLWEAAQSYNDSISVNNFGGDVFTEKQEDLKGTPYWSVLNTGGKGVMGYLSIPKIDQTIPIYHGTTDKVLQVGVGHMAGTKLPIGGASTHSVLSAHRGLPSARLFTDIDQLKKGDKFYIHVLNKVLAYEVDQVLPKVKKDDLDTLTNAMQIVEGQDYVTLFTCTPYGVNSHRLLVRGHQVEYHGENDDAGTADGTMLKSLHNYYMLYLILATAVTILTVLSIKGIRSLTKKTQPKEE
ncbi:MAG: class C sortase [Muricomes sp.]